MHLFKTLRCRTLTSGIYLDQLKINDRREFQGWLVGWWWLLVVVVVVGGGWMVGGG